MLAVDIASFGSRDPNAQRYLHDSLYQIVEDACENAGLPWSACHHEDRGDGILFIAPPIISAELLDPLAAHLHAALRRHNRHTSTSAKILRMAIHAGYITVSNKETRTSAWIWLPNTVDWHIPANLPCKANAAEMT
jgi:hypothetical protein